jgi:hypothetical protein
MGMFDSVMVRYPLDVPAHNQMWFQTKDLDNSLSRYLVDEQGYLWHEIREFRFHTPGEEPDPSPLPEPVIEQVPYHGDVDVRGGGMLEQDEVRYLLRFIDGRVARVARATERSEYGFLHWPDYPFPRIEPRTTTLVAPVFPPLNA